MLSRLSDFVHQFLECGLILLYVNAIMFFSNTLFIVRFSNLHSLEKNSPNFLMNVIKLKQKRSAEHAYWEDVTKFGYEGHKYVI